MSNEKLKIRRNAEKEDGLFIYGDNNDQALARIYPSENQEATAEMIVNAVNMHDELVEATKTTILYLEMKGQKEIDFFGRERFFRLKQLINKSHK